MNKKEREQIKKIDQLDQQLDYTIKNIGQVNVKSIKLNKKKLLLLIIIPFSFACLLAAIASFLFIDPFHWYTKSRSEIEQTQSEKIKKIKDEFDNLNLASPIEIDGEKTIGDLIELLENDRIIRDIVDPYEFQIITDRNRSDKLQSDNVEKNITEKFNIEITVVTGLLKEKIKIDLNVIIWNSYIMKMNKLIKNVDFLKDISNAVSAQGTNRISNIIEFVKQHKNCQWIFDGIDFNITKSKTKDNEIIAKGLKVINFDLTFYDKKLNKSITSAFDLKAELQGKTRKEINQYLADNLNPLGKNEYFGYMFFAQTVFVETSTYQDLINELTLSAPKNNFYLINDDTKNFDNSYSKISVDFTVVSHSPDDKIGVDNGFVDEWYETKLELHFFVGNGEDKCESRYAKRNGVRIIKEDLKHKELFLYTSRVRDEIWQFLLKYEVKIKIDGKNTYGNFVTEIRTEIDKLLQKIKKQENIFFGVDYNFGSYHIPHDSKNLITKNSLYNKRFYRSLFSFYKVGDLDFKGKGVPSFNFDFLLDK